MKEQERGAWAESLCLALSLSVPFFHQQRLRNQDVGCRVRICVFRVTCAPQYLLALRVPAPMVLIILLRFCRRLSKDTPIRSIWAAAVWRFAPQFKHSFDQIL